MGLDKSSQAIHNSRLHLSSAFRTGNLLFAYCHTDVGWYRTALSYRGCSVLLRNCTDTGAGCYQYKVRYVRDMYRYRTTVLLYCSAS
jgi:hypothetical protein